MSPEIMRQYLAARAPELAVVELPEAHTTEYISRAWKVLPAQVAKTLELRVGENAIIVVTGGDSKARQPQVKEERGNIAHLSSSYVLESDGKQVARGINSIQAIKEAGGWRVTGIMVQAESATAPLPKEYLP